MPDNSAVLEEAQAAYLGCLREGNGSKAAEVIDGVIAQGIPPARIYLKVLMPAQLQLGELWHAGHMSICEEHLATQITINEMTRLRHLCQPKCSLGVRAVIATIDGDSHFIGGKVVGDFLFMDGWEVDFLGTNLPTEDILNFVKSRQTDLIGVSVTMDQFLPELEKLIQGLRSLEKAPKIMVGGPAVRRAPQSYIQRIAPDAVAHDAKEAVEEARKICGLLGSHATLNQYLKGLGSRILEARKHRRMSQQELANTSGLDRAYISSVENGKQNLTIGAIFKLADALDISLEELLISKKTRKFDS